MVRHQQDFYIFRLEPLLQQVVVHGKGEAGDGVDLPIGEHGLAHGKADVLDFHLRLIDAVLFDERLPLGKGAIGRRSAEHLAFEVLGLADAGLGRGCNRERRPVVHHQDRLNSLVGVLVLKFDQRVDVEESERIGAGCDPCNPGDRTGTGVDRDIESFRFVITLVDGNEIGRRRPLELPVQGELHIGICLELARRKHERCSTHQHR